MNFQLFFTRFSLWKLHTCMYVCLAMLCYSEPDVQIKCNVKTIFMEGLKSNRHRNCIYGTYIYGVVPERRRHKCSRVSPNKKDSTSTYCSFKFFLVHFDYFFCLKNFCSSSILHFNFYVFFFSFYSRDNKHFSFFFLLFAMFLNSFCIDEVVMMGN